MKRYLIILGAIIVIAIVAVIGLYLWKQSSATSPTTVGNGTTGSLPTTGTQGSSGNNGTGGTGNGSTGGTGSNGGTGSTGGGGNSTNPALVAGSFGPLSNDPVLNYFVRSDNTVLIIEPNGVIARIAAGQISYLSSSTATNVIGGGFSADGKKAFLTFGDQNFPQTASFDVSSSVWSSLPQGMLSPQWSPIAGDYRIAYLAAATGTETLATLDASNPKKGSTSIFAFYAADLSMQWYGKTQFFLVSRPSGQAPGNAMVFDSSANTLSPIAVNEPGIEGAWTTPSIPASTPPEGLISYTSLGGSYALQLVNSIGNIVQTMSIETLPTKCGFSMASSSATAAARATSSSTGSTQSIIPTAPGGSATGTASGNASAPKQYLALYCGIPRQSSGFLSSNIPDDYNQLALYTSDDIYRVNTNSPTGEATALWNDASQNVDVSDLKVMGSEVFFIDRYTQKLFTLTVQN
jgi:hypothetical protein